jgi:transposase
VVADGLDPGRLDGLVNIGVDEVSWRRHHRYLTLVADHTGKKIVWGSPGKDTAALEAASMDMGPAFAKSVATHAPTAVRCIDPFHAVKLVTDALDIVRRATWNELRKLPDQGAAKKFKGARWALLKRPENLTDDQNTTLRQLRRRGGDLWRAYSLKEAFREISPETSTPTRPPSSSTAGARGLAAPESPRSSRSPRPSASSATASSPPSALRSTMVGSKDSTTTSA